MTEPFMATDLMATGWALAVFAVVLFMPGYVFGWLLGLFGFRQRTLLARCAISVPLSVAICPILTYLLWRWSPVAVWLMYGGCAIAFGALLYYERRRLLSRPKLTKRNVAVLAIAAGWVVICTFCLVDLQIGDRLYVPGVSYDYMLRSAVTSAVTRTGVPPLNPYFFPGRPFVLRYHYFWYALCSVVDGAGGRAITARQAVIAGTVWVGIALMALVALYLRFFPAQRPRDLDRRVLLGVSLLAVTGLDAVMGILVFVLTGRFHMNVQFFNTPILSWVNTAFWQPHSLAGLIACLTGFLAGWSAWREAGALRRTAGCVAAGVAYASSVGLSVYVAFVFAVFLMGWLAVLVARKKFIEAGFTCLSGGVAVLASSPYLLGLLGGTGHGGGGGPVLQFAIRIFYPAAVFMEGTWPHEAWLAPLVNALMIPANYLLGLGFFLVAGVIQWHRIRRAGRAVSTEHLCGLVMLTASFLVSTFVRSSVIVENDLGMRAITVAQFVLLLWAVELWDEELFSAEARARPVRKNAISGENRYRWMVAMLVLGVSGTVYDVCMLRWYPVLLDDLSIPRYRWLAPDHSLGKRTYAMRQLYEGLKRKLPERAIVQHNPSVSPGDVFFGLYADRQAAAETPTCGAVFGGDPALCPGVLAPIRELFEGSRRITATELEATCRGLSIDALVVKNTDKVWADKSSWVWQERPLLANEYGRVVGCGKARAEGIMEQ